MSRESPPLRARIADCSYWQSEERIELRATLRNEDERPFFTATGVRQIGFDAQTRTLDLWFSDHGRDPQASESSRHPDAVPQTQSVAAGETLTIRASVPRTLTRLVPHADDSFHFETLDLSDVARVIVHLAVSDKPFYLNPKRGTPRRQLIRWGEPLTASAAAGPPVGENGEDSRSGRKAT